MTCLRSLPLLYAEHGMSSGVASRFSRSEGALEIQAAHAGGGGRCVTSPARSGERCDKGLGGG